MSEQWESRPIGDLAEVIAGQSPSGDHLHGHKVGLPFYQGVRDFGAKYPGVSVWTDDPRKKACAGDVLLSVRAPVGRVNFAREEVAIGRGIAALRPRTGVDGGWLYQALRALEEDWGAHESAGSVFTNLSRQDIENREIPVPPLEVQRRIANALGALDDLIEVDRALLEDLDKGFLVSWELAASGTGVSTTLAEHITVTKGLSYKGAFLRDSGMPMVNMGSFGVGGTYKYSGLKWYDESQVKEKFLLNQGDLVVANTDLTQARDILARPIINPHPSATSTHHTFQVKVHAGIAARYWVYAALRQETVRQRLIAHATGTTVAALPLDALLSQSVPWAPSAEMEAWWRDAEPLISGRLALVEEMDRFDALRNELRSLLVSGRVTFEDVA